MLRFAVYSRKDLEQKRDHKDLTLARWRTAHAVRGRPPAYLLSALSRVLLGLANCFEVGAHEGVRRCFIDSTRCDRTQVSLKQFQYVIYVAAAVELVRSVKPGLALVAACPLSNDKSVGKWRSATRSERAWTAADLNISAGTRGATTDSWAANALIQCGGLQTAGVEQPQYWLKRVWLTQTTGNDSPR